MAETSSFKVIIAGGGIANLTLANFLQHADIDYVILEARDVVAPNVGALIGMFSNGGRILDQLGVYDDILAQTEPTKWMRNWKDGKLIIRKDAPQLLQARTGYPITFGDRQMVLQALYDGIRKKSNVLVNKGVASVDRSEKGVTVHCTDGSKYDGDVAIGADGVYSMIRHEMWRIAGITEPGRISKEEKDTMMSEYTCVYGISSESDLPPGGIEVVHGHDVSALAIVGKEKRTFWFLINKMDQQYRVPNTPRWTKKDAEKRIQAHLDFRITDKSCRLRALLCVL